MACQSASKKNPRFGMSLRGVTGFSRRWLIYRMSPTCSCARLSRVTRTGSVRREARDAVGEASADARHPASASQGAQSPYADMRLACYVASAMQVDLSTRRGQGRRNVMWRKLLWPGKRRWIVIPGWPRPREQITPPGARGQPCLK